MLNQLASYFSVLFQPITPPQQTYRSELEQYIISKNPQSIADIDHWTRQFDRNQKQRTTWL